jgi:hypothetical protein
LEAQCLPKSGDKLRGIRYFIQKLIFPSETTQISFYSERKARWDRKQDASGIYLAIFGGGIQYLRRKFILFLKRFASKKHRFAPQVFHVLFHLCTSLTLFIRRSGHPAFVGLQRDAVHTCCTPVRRYSAAHPTDLCADYACYAIKKTSKFNTTKNTKSPNWAGLNKARSKNLLDTALSKNNETATTAINEDRKTRS